MDFFRHKSAILDEGSVIGKGTKIWHFCHVMSTASIGENCVLGQNVFVGNQVVINNNVKVQNNVSLYEGVICEDDVFLGPSMVFTNVINPRSFIERKQEYRTTLVKQGASIGANATIICGNTVGKYSMVGAGAVVTKDVKNFALIVGNPGKHIGWVSKVGHRLEFDRNGVGVCSESGEKYCLKNDQVEMIG